MTTLITLLKACDTFKKTTYYWDHDTLTHEENSIRNYPAPWINKTLELLKIIDAKVMVEIGSTRMEFTRRCIDYFDHSMKLESKDAPPCCQDGHSTYFWARSGIEIHSVDIDEHCRTQLLNGYKYHTHEDPPQNLHLHIPNDGIEFLRNFNKKIDFLYLDGWDKGTDQYAERHLEAFLAAQDKLADTHLISIDDTDFTTDSGGKDKILTPFLLENGYIKLISGRQSIFTKK